MHSSVIISKESLNSQLISLSANLRDLWPRIFSHNYIFDTSGAGRKVVLVGIFVSRHKPTDSFCLFIVPFSISETFYYINSAVREASEAAFKQ